MFEKSINLPGTGVKRFRWGGRVGCLSCATRTASSCHCHAAEFVCVRRLIVLCCAYRPCRDKPRLISDGEKMALLYNIACCHSQLQDARAGLVALAGAVCVVGSCWWRL